MNKAKTDGKQKINFWLFPLFTIWIVFSICYLKLGLTNGSMPIAGTLSLVVEMILDFSVVFFSYSLSFKCQREEVAIFLLFFIAFLMRIINDLAYNVIVNILLFDEGKTGLDLISSVTNTMTMLFVILALIFVFSKTKKQNSKRSLWGLLVINILVFAGMFYCFRNEKWVENIVSVSDFYVWANVILRGFVFSFLIINLLINKSRYFRFVLSCFQKSSATVYKKLKFDIFKVLAFSALLKLRLCF